MSVQAAIGRGERTSSMLRKVPEVTIWFWVIKVLATTVGETAADFLGVNLHLGLTGTTIIMTGVLLGALYLQFKATRYVPWIYWVSIVLISVVGTLITDNLTDNLGVPLTTTTVVFAAALIATFSFWYASERTLSIHSIYTRKREAFYWLAILFTFALGTAAGDLVAESFGVGYLVSAILFASLIGIITAGYFFAGLSEIVAFWLVYILTRPLGASIGDLLSQPREDGGLGLGTTVTSALFLAAIAGVVVYLSRSKVDVEELTDSHLFAGSAALVGAATSVVGVAEPILAAGVFDVQGEPRQVLVAVTDATIHVLGWDGDGHPTREMQRFIRATTIVLITDHGAHRRLHLTDEPSGLRMNLVGSTASYDEDSTGDRLVVHLLGGSE